MKKLLAIILLNLCLLLCHSSLIYAADGDSDKQTIGTMLSNITKSFTNITVLLFSLSVIVGLCFSIAAIFKFKQFKDNPQQVTIGQPIGLLLLGAAMLWLPYIIKSFGFTMTGAKNEKQLQEEKSFLGDDADEGTGLNKYRIK